MHLVDKDIDITSNLSKTEYEISIAIMSWRSYNKKNITMKRKKKKKKKTGDQMGLKEYIKYLQSGQYVTRVLHKFIQVNNRATSPSLLLEEHLQFPQFVKCSHIWAIKSETTNHKSMPISPNFSKNW